jgi:chorismate dehydratase
MTAGAPVRLGAVAYLNARPLVHGLDGDPRFQIRYDVPSRCAQLLEGGGLDVGMIPSIEYVNGRGAYRIVPELAIASRGPVASVALFTAKPIAAVTSIVMDTSSRTSVALVRVLCQRLFAIQPRLKAAAPDLPAMLDEADAALLIGDNALLWNGDAGIEKIDLGEAWTGLTGLPFVWAVWTGRAGALTPDHVKALQASRDLGVRDIDRIARDYFVDRPQFQSLGARYLRDNIKYYLGEAERDGLELFYRYSREAGVVSDATSLRFY